MKVINSITQMLEALPIEIKTHRQKDSTELPSFSIIQLSHEAGSLCDYFESEDNYVPHYHGCGLIHACLMELKASGYKISPILFSLHFGLNYEDAKYIASKF